MPGKTVRFADVPSPTFSDSTLSGSPGPATPPPISYSPPTGKATYKPYVPYQPAYAASVVHMHPLLARTLSGYGTPLAWDLSEPAETARPQLADGPAHLTNALLSEAATYPPLPTLALTCEHLPWTIMITPTPGASWSCAHVTVGDVLHALYRALRLGASPLELATLSPTHVARVEAACARRVSHVRDRNARAVEAHKGIKRVDFLGSHRAFLGLAPVPGGLPAKGLAPGAVWELRVARAEGAAA